MRTISLALATAGGLFAVTVALRTTFLSGPVLRSDTKTLEAELLQSPGKAVMQGLSLNYRHALADVLWLDTLGSFPETNSGTGWERVKRGADLITDLDPRYMTVYEGAGVSLSVWAKRTDDAEVLFKKGMKHMPKEWKFPFYLGYDAFFERGDPKEAAKWMEKAGRLGGPRYLASLAGRFRFFAGDEVGAIKMLEEMIPQLSGMAAVDAKGRLALLKSEPILRRFDEACRRYLAETGKMPTAEVLVASGRVAGPAQDATGAEIRLNADCVAETKTISGMNRTNEKRLQQLRAAASSTKAAAREGDPVPKKD